MKEKLPIFEALLYVVGEEGLTLEQITQVLTCSNGEALEMVERYKRELLDSGRGLALAEIAGGFQLVTKPELFHYIEKLVETPKPANLTQAALETLAIIAYKQPVSRAEIEDMRGIKSEKSLHNLVAKGLIKEVGRAEGTGRAILYGVTSSFLVHFGLKSIEELPPMPENPESFQENAADLFYSRFQQTVMDI